MTQGVVAQSVQACRTFFASGKTRDVGFRKAQLKALKTAVKSREAKLMEALQADLHKASVESYLSEIGFLYEEIDYALKNIDEWVKPQRVTTSLLHTIGSSRIISEPLGVVLIIAPWNYPFQLLM